MFRVFGGDRIKGLMTMFNIEDLPIESKMLTDALNEAQRKVEAYFFGERLLSLVTSSSRLDWWKLLTRTSRSFRRGKKNCWSAPVLERTGGRWERGKRKRRCLYVAIGAAMRDVLYTFSGVSARKCVLYMTLS